MLAKQNYAPYLAAILFAGFAGYRKEAVANFLAHFIPLLLWLGCLYLIGIPYYNHEVEKYRQGVWILQDFIHLDLLAMLKTLLISVRDYCLAFLMYFGPFSFLGFLGALMIFISEKWKFPSHLLLALFLLMEWFTTFAAWRFDTYMTAGMSLFIFPLSVYPLSKLKKHREWLLSAIVVVWLAYNIYRVIHFPWVHPYNQ